MRNTKLWLLSGLAWTECIFRHYIANQQWGSALFWKKWMVGPFITKTFWHIYNRNLMQYSLNICCDFEILEAWYYCLYFAHQTIIFRYLHSGITSCTVIHAAFAQEGVALRYHYNFFFAKSRLRLQWSHLAVFIITINSFVHEIIIKIPGLGLPSPSRSLGEYNEYINVYIYIYII